MPTIAVETELVLELLGRRDALVHAITAGMTSGEWDEVMRAFDGGLLLALRRLEESLPSPGPESA